MADDQKPKTMDINDLVRELSKSSTSPTTPPPVAPQVSRPPFPTPPSAGSGPSAKPEMPKPQFNVPSAPFSKPSQPLPVQPKPVPIAPLPTPGVKEYQSSIRTMNEDISKIKQGQQPTGVPVPRKVEQVVPVLPVTPTPAKPIAPAQQFKVPSVNLGEAQKATPLAPSKEILKVPSVPKVEPKTQIFIPQEGAKGGNRNMLFIGIGTVAILAGFAYWFFVLRAPAPEVVIESPTPTPVETAKPQLLLADYFSGTAKNLNIEPNTDFTFQISKFFAETNFASKEFEKIDIIGTVNGTTKKLNFMDFLNESKIGYPEQLKSLIGDEFQLLGYGQTETFGTANVTKAGVYIAEVKDTNLIGAVLTEWESTISKDFLSPLDVLASSEIFLDNTYNGIPIRYRNFPNPDTALDIAVLKASSGKNYLIVGGSRESTYSAIDKLKGF